MDLQPVQETDTVMALARGIESSNDNDVLICTWTKCRHVSFMSELSYISWCHRKEPSRNGVQHHRSRSE
jgi:hypothetical protein